MTTTLFNDPRANLNLVTYKAAPLPLPEFLTQGALAGAFAFFFIPVGISFNIDNYYKVLVFALLPPYLGFGLALGLVYGLAVWGCSKYLANRTPAAHRSAIAIVLVGGLFLWLNRNPDNLLQLIVFPLITICSLSLITGSRCRPWRGLTLGLRHINTQQPFLATVIGFVLRIALIFLCFYSMFVFICLVEMNEDFVDLLVLGLTFSYASLGLVVALANARFWLTLVAALMLNAPWLYILVVYYDRFELNMFFVFYLGYLLLWFGFLLTHCPGLRPVFSSLNEELRYYYLID